MPDAAYVVLFPPDSIYLQPAVGECPRRAGRLRRPPLRGRVARWNPARCTEADVWLSCCSGRNSAEGALRNTLSGIGERTSADEYERSGRQTFRQRAKAYISVSCRSLRGSKLPHISPQRVAQPTASSDLLPVLATILRLHWTGRRESTRVSLPVHSRRQLRAWRTEQRETMSSYTNPRRREMQKNARTQAQPCKSASKGEKRLMMGIRRSLCRDRGATRTDRDMPDAAYVVLFPPDSIYLQPAVGECPRQAGRLRRLPLRGRVARWNPARCMEADCRCLAVPHATPRREPCATRSPESGNAPPQTNTSAPDDKHSTNAPKRIYRFRADPCVGRNFRTYLRRGSHSPPQARTCCLCSTATLRLHWTGRRESTRVSLPVHSRRQLRAWRTEQRETMSSYTNPRRREMQKNARA